MDNQDEHEHYRKRRQELMKPIDAQIMMADDQNEILLLSSAMVSRGYEIFQSQYGRASARRLVETLLEIIDDKLDSER